MDTRLPGSVALRPAAVAEGAGCRAGQGNGGEDLRDFAGPSGTPGLAGWSQQACRVPSGVRVLSQGLSEGWAQAQSPRASDGRSGEN